MEPESGQGNGDERLEVGKERGFGGFDGVVTVDVGGDGDDGTQEAHVKGGPKDGADGEGEDE